VVDSEEDLATVAEVHHAAAADEGAHCVQKKAEEVGTVVGVAADHTVAADCMLAERSWDDNSVQTKELVAVYAALEVVGGVAVEADHDVAGHAAEGDDRSAIVDQSSQHLVDLADQELEGLYMVQHSDVH
jgi:hypothetical protein